MSFTRNYLIFMKNIIRFNIDGNVSIYHNDQLVTTEEVSCVYGKNILRVEGKDFTINELSMFGIGNDILYKLGKHQGDYWFLEYEYPVFSWLHKTLQHGWLLKEDNE